MDLVSFNAKSTMYTASCEVPIPSQVEYIEAEKKNSSVEMNFVITFLLNFHQFIYSGSAIKPISITVLTICKKLTAYSRLNRIIQWRR